MRVEILGLLALLSWLPSVARAQTDELDAFEQTKIRLNFEPSVSECLNASLRYFRVDYKTFDRLRGAAKRRGLLPTIAAGYRLDDTTQNTNGISAPTSTTVTNQLVQGRVSTISVGGVWDLRELVFNPAEVQVYGLIGVQRGLMLELTRIFFLRKQLFVRFVNSPPKDPLAREALALRVDEFTALLDVLTGGWFSRTTDQRMQERTGRRGKRSEAQRPATRPAPANPPPPANTTTRPGPRPALRTWQGGRTSPW